MSEHRGQVRKQLALAATCVSVSQLVNNDTGYSGWLVRFRTPEGDLLEWFKTYRHDKTTETVAGESYLIVAVVRAWKVLQGEPITVLEKVKLHPVPSLTNE